MALTIQQEKRVASLKERLVKEMWKEQQLDAQIGKLMSRRVDGEERQAAIMSNIEAIVGEYSHGRPPLTA